MKKFGYIYKTVNKKNKKIYIGQSCGQFKPTYLGSGIHISRAIRKNGIESFEVKVITYAKNKKQLDMLERKYIAEYRKQFPKSVYNIDDGGTGASWGDTNVAKRPEVRKKIRLAAKLQFSNPKYRKFLSDLAKKRIGKLNAMYGKRQSEETKRMISKANLGRKPTKETKLKMSLAGKGRPSHRKGKTLPKETCEKMSRSHTGTIMPKETRRKISQARIRYFSLPENRKKQSLAMMGHS